MTDKENTQQERIPSAVPNDEDVLILERRTGSPGSVLNVHIIPPSGESTVAWVEAADLRRALDALDPQQGLPLGDPDEETDDALPYPEWDHDHRRANALRDAADVLRSCRNPASSVPTDDVVRLAEWITDTPTMTDDPANGLAPEEDPRQDRLFTPAVMAVEEVDEVLANACREGYGSVREVLVRCLESLGVVVNR